MSSTYCSGNMGCSRTFLLGVVALVLCLISFGGRQKRVPSWPPQVASLRKAEFHDGTTTTSAPAPLSDSCDVHWPTFAPDRPLNTTYIIHPDDSPNTTQRQQAMLEYIQQSPPTGLFVYPPNRFAFCTMPKTGCTQWVEVLGKILRDDPTYDYRDYHLPQKSQDKFHLRQNPRAIQQIFQSPNSTRAVFIREPMARFLSAFLDKCFGKHCDNKLCYARSFHNIPPGTPITFRQALDWILHPGTLVDGTMNAHYQPQTFMCGLSHPDALHSMYNIVAYLDKKTVSKDAACIMERAGLTRYNTRGGGPEEDPFWVSLTEIPIFNYRPANQEEENLKRFFTPELARQFMEKYRVDYETLHIPEPAWVQHATGEWLDSLDLPMKQCP